MSQNPFPPPAPAAAPFDVPLEAPAQEALPPTLNTALLSPEAQNLYEAEKWTTINATQASLSTLAMSTLPAARAAGIAINGTEKMFQPLTSL